VRRTPLRMTIGIRCTPVKRPNGASGGGGPVVQHTERPRRTPLSRGRVLRAAVALADDGGIDALSMRRLAQELGVVPMALYKHVANKDEMLGGMIDVVVGEIDPPLSGTDWETRARPRVLALRG